MVSGGTQSFGLPGCTRSMNEEILRDDAENCLPANVMTRRASCKGETSRSLFQRAQLSQIPLMPCVTGSLGADHPLEDEAAEETALAEADIMELTLRFLFGDPAGVKATGPSGSAARATLGLIVNGLAVLKALWPSRRAEIKALLADEKGRFDKEELLAHIINNSLGRPLLPQGNAARDIGTATNNALKKEKRETAEANFAKARTGAAISAARAAACEDAARLPEIAAAEAARAAQLAAVLAQEWDLSLPNWTVGVKRKREAALDNIGNSTKIGITWPKINIFKIVLQEMKP